MRLEFCYPKEIEDAKQAGLPLIIPAGNVEYHGPHCVVGCDTLVIKGLLRELEKVKDIVIAPAIEYGPSSYAVAGPEKGTIDVNLDNFERHVYDILKAYLYGGWKNIYVLVHHQYKDGNLYPMTLSYMKAAKLLVFEYLEETEGIGWYEKLHQLKNRWNWITVLPTMSREVQEQTGYDHAGKWESSLMEALYPGSIRPERISEDSEWFIREALDFSPELGKRMLRLCLEDLQEKIK